MQRWTRKAIKNGGLDGFPSFFFRHSSRSSHYLHVTLYSYFTISVYLFKSGRLSVCLSVRLPAYLPALVFVGLFLSIGESVGQSVGQLTS